MSQRLDVGGRFETQVVDCSSPGPGADRRKPSKSGKVKVRIVLQIKQSGSRLIKEHRTLIVETESAGKLFGLLF